MKQTFDSLVEFVMFSREHHNLSSLFSEYIFLQPDYTIRMAGKSVEEMLRYSYGELCGKPLNALAKQGDFVSVLQGQIEHGETGFLPFEFVDKKGDPFPVLISIAGLTGSGKTPSPGLIRVRSQSSTRAAESHRLSYWIAHNLKAPLATLEGLVHLARVDDKRNTFPLYLSLMKQEMENLDEKLTLMQKLTLRYLKK